MSRTVSSGLSMLAFLALLAILTAPLGAEPPDPQPQELAGSIRVTVTELEAICPIAVEHLRDWGMDSTVYFFQDDKVISGDFELDTFQDDETLGFVFAKNLTIEGDLLQMEMNFGPHLLVIGNLAANHIDKSGSHIEVLGDCTVKGLIYGYYNDGSFKVDGTVSAPYIFSFDHCFDFGFLDTSVLVADLDVFGCQLDRLFVAGVIEDSDHMDSQQAREFLDAGKEILIDGWECTPRDDD